MTAAEVRVLIKARCEAAGSQRKWAKSVKLSPAFVNLVLQGQEPSDAILKPLGLKRVVSYERVSYERE